LMKASGEKSALLPRLCERPCNAATMLGLALLFCFFFAAVTGNAYAQITLPGPGVINTVAGDGVQGYSGDGGAATGAKLYAPTGVAVDAAGNIYFSDYGNERIRKVTASTGTISTVAGNGTRGYSGDGGLATNAELDEPLGVAVDSIGNIYFADEGNYRVREVEVSTGDIYTVAGNGTPGYSGDGGPATGAELYCPAGVAVDTTRNLYIGDLCTHRVRKVEEGIILTVAGDGTQGYSGDGGAATKAELNAPFGLAVDSSFNIYIGDYGENRVRKVTFSTGIISTVAGNGTVGYSGDGGSATSAELDNPHGVALDLNGNIYIADVGNSRVREVTVATGIISTVAGNGTAGYSGDGGEATSAKLDAPEGVALDSTGNIYIADSSNNRVRAVGTESVGTGPDISTVAGDGGGGYSGDGGKATSAEIFGPFGVALDASGNIYIADYYNNRVRRVTTAGIISTVAGNGTGGYSGDGGAATSAELSHPSGVTVDSAGNFYIADQTNNRIRKVTTTGIISTVAGNGTQGYSGDGGAATSAELNQPYGVTVDSAGNIYIADFLNNRVRKVTVSTGKISTVAGDGTGGYSGDGGAATSAELDGPTNVAVDSAGNIYIADSDNNRIRKVTASTGIISTVAGDGTAGYSGDGGAATSADLNLAYGVALDASGNIYIGDWANHRVRKVTISTGIISTVAGDGIGGYSGDGGPATIAELDSPAGVAVDTAGDLYIADASENRIRAVGH
jgi:uncharacterized protein YjiK